MLPRLAVLCLLPLAGSLAGTATQPAPPPDLVLYNGRVMTLDQSNSIAEAVAIAAGRFLAIGRSDDIRRLASPSTRVVDLRGRLVVPGLMDNHLHNAGGGPGVDLSRARLLADVLAAVAARVRTSRSGDIVVSNSDWHEAQLIEQRLPLRDDLDTVAPTIPVVLVRGGHEYILNSAALAHWKIDERTPVPAW